MQHIWIFQLHTAMSAGTQATVQQDLNAFLEAWKAHGTPVPGTAEIRYDQFVIVQATPGATSGCSIDSMTHGVEAILKKVKAEIAPNNLIFYRTNEGGIDKVDFREVSAAIAGGHMHADTIIYDASMGQENDLNKWEVRLGESWLARFVPA
ncbi:MAG: hypothetical protein AAF570_24300 [Bacteroidota bacterium]